MHYFLDNLITNISLFFDNSRKYIAMAFQYNPQKQSFKGIPYKGILFGAISFSGYYRFVVISDLYASAIPILEGSIN